MNLPTHIMFGALIGALFFGRWDIILLVAIGSVLPDMDREYGFFSKDYFRGHQLHRALYHNFVFIGILFLISPYLAIGAFCHTLLDGINTAKDRGVEWLYPFSRLVKKARYDHEGKKIAPDIKTKVYMYQNDPVELTRKTAADMKDFTLRPWRRIYGPFYSGGILDIGIFVGSTALILFLALLSVFGVRTFTDFYHPQFSFNFIGPLLIGVLGISLVLGVGEIKRHIEAKKASRAPPMLWKLSFFLSNFLIAFGVGLGAYLNPSSYTTFTSNLPYLAAGILVVFLTAYILLKIYSSKSIARMRNGHDPYAV
ncbi:MAG: metal-dependent hydrolase [Candidatus Bathyarchaeia archaeon]